MKGPLRAPEIYGAQGLSGESIGPGNKSQVYHLAQILSVLHKEVKEEKALYALKWIHK